MSQVEETSLPFLRIRGEECTSHTGQPVLVAQVKRSCSALPCSIHAFPVSGSHSPFCNLGQCPSCFRVLVASQDALRKHESRSGAFRASGQWGSRVVLFKKAVTWSRPCRRQSFQGRHAEKCVSSYEGPSDPPSTHSVGCVPLHLPLTHPWEVSGPTGQMGSSPSVDRIESIPGSLS